MARFIGWGVKDKVQGGSFVKHFGTSSKSHDAKALAEVEAERMNKEVGHQRYYADVYPYKI